MHYVLAICGGIFFGLVAFELTVQALRSFDNIELRTREFDGPRTERISVRRDLKVSITAALVIALGVMLAASCAGVSALITDWAVHAIANAIRDLSLRMLGGMALAILLCSLSAAIYWRVNKRS